MQIFIPTIGTVLRLTKPWHFTLFHEYRNETMFEHLGLKMESRRYGVNVATDAAKLPKGSELRVDRIYIRKGGSDFDSVTFFLKGARTKASVRTRTATAIGYGQRSSIQYEEKVPSRGVRFWAKLTDVNTMHAEVIPK